MRPIVLDAYAARSCPVKTFNAFDPTQPRPEVGDESLSEAFHGGLLFEREMLDEVVASTGATDLRGLVGGDREVALEACRAALERGDEIVVGGVLPTDVEGHRSGRPDLLVRGPDTADGRPGYHPVEVKLHRALERRPGNQVTWVSPLSAPGRSSAVGLTRLSYRASKELTLLQMAHYWRLLEAAGHAAGGPSLVGIIGTDDIEEVGGRGVTWVDLDAKIIRTFSRTSADGWKLRSPMERYAHEHRFRVHVATLAAARTGVDDTPAPVVPIVVRECDHCQWWERCRGQLHDEAISLRINKTPLDVREISALSRLGIQTVSDLATADIESLLVGYLPEVRHREGAESRVRLAARRARLLSTGVELERVTSGPIGVPRAGIEIDLDIETSESGRTYLWGLLITDKASRTTTYRAFVRFEDLTKASEGELLEEFAEFLVPLLEGGDTLVYHYSDYEKVFLQRLARSSTHAGVQRLVALMPDTFVDLFSLVREHFFGAHGLGLKTVASDGAGFGWRDDDPGGLNSQAWFNDAVHAGDESVREAARVRVLEYNEDDVLATKALREWMSAQPDESASS